MASTRVAVAKRVPGVNNDDDVDARQPHQASLFLPAVISAAPTGDGEDAVCQRRRQDAEAAHPGQGAPAQRGEAQGAEGGLRLSEGEERRPPARAYRIGNVGRGYLDVSTPFPDSVHNVVPTYCSVFRCEWTKSLDALDVLEHKMYTF